jgi:hypothetical protein
MTEITSHYDSAAGAENTIKALVRQGFLPEQMTARSPGAQELHWVVSIRPPFGMGRLAEEIMGRYSPLHSVQRNERVRDEGLEAIARLSGPVSPGAISRLSRHVAPGSISALSGHKSPGAISSLSGHKSPGAIARLSGPKSPGAISQLSGPKSPGAISRLSAGWYFSDLLGLPLLSSR